MPRQWDMSNRNTRGPQGWISSRRSLIQSDTMSLRSCLTAWVRKANTTASNSPRHPTAQDSCIRNATSLTNDFFMVFSFFWCMQCQGYQKLFFSRQSYWVILSSFFLHAHPQKVLAPGNSSTKLMYYSKFDNGIQSIPDTLRFWYGLPSPDAPDTSEWCIKIASSSFRPNQSWKWRKTSWQR